ncbi:MAG: putative zinc-binding metallopeptidase [Cyclobacteriaceae bacterium]|nr:putative zinc-binding metallopeptidase [Cyclobacteriaceae bacterium SS2]
MKINNILLLVGLVLSISSCFPSEELNVPVKDVNEGNLTDLDIYINDNFLEEFNMAIRYKYEDRFVDPNEKAIPPRLSAVMPMLDFIQQYWIDPYLEVSNGEVFFRNHVPAEIVFLGGPIYNVDGTLTLGTADAGARITFTDVNSVNPDDEDWRDLQLNVVYHEFSHIVHQRYKLPAGFETISPNGYSGPGSWYTLTDEEALQRGFVTPYATLNPNEDFAETVAFYLFDSQFAQKFTIAETNCQTSDCENRNTGRALIRQKVSAISNHYEKVTGINLESLRNIIQAKL